MNKFDTLLRVVYTLGLSLVLAPFASAQSAAPQGTVLNFVKATVNSQSNAGFAVINPTSNYADVQFTFYGLDGNPVASSSQNPNFQNPVRYRVAPKGQVSMFATDLFAASTVDGWVQATSPTPGLTGAYLLGDFATTLESSRPAAAATTQVLPLIRQDSADDTQLVIVNPMTSAGSVTIELHAPGGQILGVPVTRSLAAHASLRLEASDIASNLPADNVSARITSTVNMSATAVINRGSTAMFVPGHRVDQQAALRVAPQFTTDGFDPTLVLTNPTNSTIPVTVTLFGTNQNAISFSIPPFGSVSKSSTELVGRPLFGQLSVNGWLRVDSPNTALDGLLILDRGLSFTAEPLESIPQAKMLFPEIFEDQSAQTGLALINPASVAVTADLFLVQVDGSTVEHSTITIPALSKISKGISDVLPNTVNQKGTYVVVQSASPLYGVTMLYATNGFIASVSPASLPSAYTPAVLAPVLNVDSGTDVQSGQTIQVTLNQIANTFSIAGQVINEVSSAPGIPTYFLTLPALEPGFVTLKATSNGVDSPPVLLHVWDAGATQTQTVSGTALFQKIDVTDSGLDLSHPVMSPIRNARVEVVDPNSQSVVSVSDTDDRGQFKLAVPPIQNLSVRVLSRIRSFDLHVGDNTNQGALYAVLANGVDGRSSSSGLLLVDTGRVSGAFNILEVVQRANETVKSADPTLPPTPVTIYWSVLNTKTESGNPAQGLIGTSEFNVTNGTAYILGDRSTDSDEFDDAVIAHEYAHMLAAKFSRDDSPGGPHSLGDMLDPRVSWSEGWANFFSSVVRNSPFWRDSMGPNGSQVLRYDLGDSSAAADPRPGYWSEASVDTLLWALYRGVDNDNVPYSFPAIWAAFTGLKNDRFVYLPYFLDNFINNIPSSTSDVIGVAQSRSIDYQPGVVPSVTNPFPMPVTVGAVIGPDTIDSLTTKRTNLVTASHFYTFTTTGGATTVRMDILPPPQGLGPGNNPAFNDLDIFLYNANGQMIDKSDSGGNGQPERMADRLAAGAYIVEVRSYYTNGQTGAIVYNSGEYTLNISIQ